MSYIDLSMLSVALGLDAFGVAISLGLDKRMTKRKALAFIFSFGFFQFLFASIGGIIGNMFNKYIFNLPSVVGGIIILLVGILMLKEGLSKEEKIIELNFFMIILLGICVSIDALVIGFSAFDHYSIIKLIFNYTSIIGIVTSALTLSAFIICKNMRKNNFIKKYSDFLGASILIIFGLKMIFF